jgi:divalent metal cation (Fe/Co/Zn/Cd) transporter
VILQKRALWLSYFTVCYNVVEGLVSIVAGMAAGSTALIGFGSDSFVESLSGSVMIWRFRKHGKISKEQEHAVERTAVQLVGYSFFILASYIILESVQKLIGREAAEKTLFGMLVAVASLIVMPTLFYLKVRTAKQIKSRSLFADSKQTLGCILLSVALLVGLLTNYLFEVWWIDSAAGLVIAGLLIREGVKTLKEKDLCCS